MAAIAAVLAPYPLTLLDLLEDRAAGPAVKARQSRLFHADDEAPPLGLDVEPFRRASCKFGTFRQCRSSRRRRQVLAEQAPEGANSALGSASVAVEHRGDPVHRAAGVAVFV